MASPDRGGSAAEASPDVVGCFPPVYCRVMMTKIRPAAATTAAKDEKYHRRLEEILDAAAAVFAAKGYHGASTTDIASCLGIRQGSLYYYVPSKQAALAEVCQRGVGGFVSALEALIAQDPPVDRLLREAIHGHLRPICERGDYVRVFLKERQHLEDAHRRSVGRTSRAYEALLGGIVRRGMAEGALRGDRDPRIVTLGILGLCNSAFDWMPPDPGQIAAVADTFADMVLDGLLDHAPRHAATRRQAHGSDPLDSPVARDV